MFAYWFLFAVFALGAMMSSRPQELPANRAAAYPGAPPPPSTRVAPGRRMFLLAALIPVVLIGLRYEVGTDYATYVLIFRQISAMDLEHALGRTDVGYAALNWLVIGIGAGFWLVNLVCALLFTFGLFRFARAQPNPWLALTVAVPYLVIAVGMGYSRQAVAIGLSMAGLAAVSKGSFPKFVAYVLAGALFHRTAVVLIPIVTVAYSRNRLVGITVGILGSIVGYYVLVSGQAFENIQRMYITRQIFESQGAAIRLAMNLPAALALLILAKRFTAETHERQTYVLLSLIAFGSIVLLYLFPRASTPLDRMALYVLPLQIFVLSRLPSAFPDERGQPSGPLTLAVVLYSAAIEFVWLNFAANARDWIPYQFYPMPWLG